ncbi:MAG: hypothetical protein VX320_03720 [Candidatus Thermoplasmatota archaeon]|nr:hypothetical protein [Candidatus Thermoplasmatota archaeon]
MWVWALFSILILLIGLLIRQRWKVTSEWLRMEKELTEDEYALWKKQKERDAENWNERMKNFEAALLFLFAFAMLGLWYLI